MAATHEQVTPDAPRGDSPNPQQIQDLNASHHYCHGVVSSRLAARTRHVRQIEASTASFPTIGSTILPVVAGLIWSDRGPIADSPASPYGPLMRFVCNPMLALSCKLSRTPGKCDEAPDLEQFRKISTQVAQTVHHPHGESLSRYGPMAASRRMTGLP